MGHSYEDLVERSQQIRLLRTLEGHTEDIESVAFTPDGQMVASGSDDHTVRLWDVATGQPIHTLEGHTGWVYSAAFSPDGGQLASGSDDHTVRLWDVATGQTLRTIEGHIGGVKVVAFSPDGRLLASGSNDHTVRLWDVATGRALRTIKGHTGNVWGVDFSPDGQLLASGSADHTVRLWEVDTGQVARTIEGHTDCVYSVPFSPDGRLLASGSDDHTVRLWEVTFGHEVRRFDNQGWVGAVAFSPNGQVLACAGEEKIVHLWEVDTNRAICSLEGHTSSIDSHALAFSPDGRLLASGSRDNTIRLWDISALDVGLKAETKPEPPIRISGTVILGPLRTHLRTLPLCHVVARVLPPGRPAAWLRGAAAAWLRGAAAAWLRGAAAAGWPLPLALAHDLGLLLTQLAGRLTIAKPGHLPFDEDTSAYLAFLQRVAAHPLVRQLPSWHPPLSDAVVGVILARLVEGVALPDAYRVPPGPEGVRLLRLLGERLEARGALPVTPERVSPAEPAPARPRIRLDQLAPDQGASFGQWQVWFKKSAGDLFFIHSDSGVVIQFSGGSEGWIDYRGYDGRRYTLFHDFDVHSISIWNPVERYLGYHPEVDVAPEATTLGKWQFEFIADKIHATLTPDLERVIIAPSESHFRYRGSFGHRYDEGTFPRPEDGTPPEVSPTQAVAEEPSTPTAQAGSAATFPATRDPAYLWQETPPDQRPSWRTLLPAASLARIERNLRSLDPDELRFLARYGAPLAGAPDPRDLLDLLALTGLPAAARLALSQTLHLLPRLSETRTVGGVQTYPEGGYEGLARKGSLDSLLPTELAYPEDLFFHRVLNAEALYYGRERPRERRRELAFLIMQVGYGLGGDGQILARALLLGLSHAMTQRGYDVLYSIAGTALSDPRPLDKPGEVARALYAYEPVIADAGRILPAALAVLRGWRDAYRGRQVLWILSEHFDADDAEAHAALYQALRGEAGQQAWFVRVGKANGNGRRPPPPAARGFEQWQVIETSVMYTDHK